MELFSKKRCNTIIVFLMTLMLMFVPSKTVRAQENNSYINNNYALLKLDKTELLSILISKGLQLPNDYKENRYLAEDFVFKYAKYIVDENLTINSVQFNYDESQELFNNLVNILLPKNNNIIQSRVATRSSNYTLRDSVIWENWKSSHWNYNCYGYSINNFRRINPGDLSGKHFSISHSISKMADNTISDLQKLGFYAYKTTEKPNYLPDKNYKVIAIRKTNDNMDYHFMRTNGNNLNFWVHKPGRTQPLKWKYASPSYKNWTNENVFKGTASSGNLVYNSTVYYILYKPKNSAGITPYSVDNSNIVLK